MRFTFSLTTTRRAASAKRCSKRALSLCRPSRSPSTSSRRSPTYRSSGATLSPRCRRCSTVSSSTRRSSLPGPLWTSTRSSRARTFSPAARTWVYSRPSAIPRTSARSTASATTTPGPGRPTDASPPTPPAGGAARIRLRCSTIRSYTTARSRLTMPTVASSKCSATNARCRPIPRSSHTLPTICSGGRACRWRKRPTSSPRRSGARSAAKPRLRPNGSPICARCFPVFLLRGRSPSCSASTAG